MKGVDLVLNSLAGEAIQKNLAVLKPFGRLLELGKRDFFANTRIGLRPFRHNVSFHGNRRRSVDGRSSPNSPSRFSPSSPRCCRTAYLRPLPYRRFDSSQVISAFRHLQQSRHVGKIVISAPSTTSREKVPLDASARLRLDPAASYLVTGGLSGFGFATRNGWLCMVRGTWFSLVVAVKERQVLPRTSGS